MIFDVISVSTYVNIVLYNRLNFTSSEMCNINKHFELCPHLHLDRLVIIMSIGIIAIIVDVQPNLVTVVFPFFGILFTA